MIQISHSKAPAGMAAMLTIQPRSGDAPAFSLALGAMASGDRGDSLPADTRQGDAATGKGLPPGVGHATIGDDAPVVLFAAPLPDVGPVSKPVEPDPVDIAEPPASAPADAIRTVAIADRPTSGPETIVRTPPPVQVEPKVPGQVVPDRRPVDGKLAPGPEQIPQGSGRGMGDDIASVRRGVPLDEITDRPLPEWVLAPSLSDVPLPPDTLHVPRAVFAAMEQVDGDTRLRSGAAATMGVPVRTAPPERIVDAPVVGIIAPAAGAPPLAAPGATPQPGAIVAPRSEPVPSVTTGLPIESPPPMLARDVANVTAAPSPAPVAMTARLVSGKPGPGPNASKGPAEPVSATSAIMGPGPRGEVVATTTPARFVATPRVEADVPGTIVAPGPRRVALAASTMPVAAPAIAAAAALADGAVPSRRAGVAILPPSPIIDPGALAAPAPVHAAAPASEAPPIDTGQAEWIDAMIEQIETLRDARADGGSATTRLRLSPDALGGIEILLTGEGDGIEVRINADTAAARQLLAEAAPRLVDLAEARGLKLGQSSVDGGGQGHREAGQHPQGRDERSAANRRATETDRDRRDSDERIA